MGIAKLISEFGFPIVAMVGLGYFVYYVWATITKVINPTIKNMHITIIKLIDQQKLAQMEVKKFHGIYKSLIEIYARKDENTDKIMRIMEKERNE